jgi:hypothetical protein
MRTLLLSVGIFNQSLLLVPSDPNRDIYRRAHCRVWFMVADFDIEKGCTDLFLAQSKMHMLRRIAPKTLTFSCLQGKTEPPSHQAYPNLPSVFDFPFLLRMEFAL